MKTIASAAMAAIEAGEAIVSGAVEILCDPPVRVWGGYGTLTLDGDDYIGVGDRGLAQQSAGAIGGFAQGMTLSLSGIDPAAIELLDSDEIKGAALVLYRLIFASDGKTLLDAAVFDRGRVDGIESMEKIGAAALISLAIESAARGLGRSGSRQRSDADQRLINATDGYFRAAAYAAEKMLYWGGKRPNGAGSSLGGGSGGRTTIPGGLLGGLIR